jgi:hypothetical protein
MWMLSTTGFISVVCKPADVARDTLTVRARVRQDLEDLRDRWLPELGEIVETRLADYGYRAFVPREAFAAGLQRLALGIDYDNFKHAVRRAQGEDRAGLYAEVWTLLTVLANEDHEWSEPDAGHGSS